MSFESVYRSKTGAGEIEKITNFLMGLVIKNNYEANDKETSLSLGEYYKYYGAYTKTDDFSDYTLDDRKKYGDYIYKPMLAASTVKTYTFNESVLKVLTNSSIRQLENNYNSKSELYVDYLKYLRLARIALYDERNVYYRQFLGLPNTDDDIVYITNYDIGKDGYVKVEDLTVPPKKNVLYYTLKDNEFVTIGLLTDWSINGVQIADNFYYLSVIPAHYLKNSSVYPNTYSRYILQEYINEVIKNNPDKTYLRFINDKFTPYYLRNMDNYGIIKYNKHILDQNELNYFFKSYNKAKQQVILDYIDGFDSKQPLYNLLMIENLLYYTVINYSNTYIEKYTLGIYTEENINNILDSHGYSKLKAIKDIELKRRIVKNLNDLIANKANNDILELILDRIIQDSNVELKRYYVEKEFNTTNTSNAINIDTSKGLEGSVKLTLREVPATSINELSTSSDDYHDYDVFVNDDDLWGGILSDDSLEVKLTKKEAIKNEILKLNFNSILTRYITLTRSIDLLDSQRKLRDYTYLLLKYLNDYKETEFFKTTVNFNQYECTPAGIFGAMCMLQQMKFYDDYDTIVKDNCVINSSAVFRRMGVKATDIQSFENKVIVDGRVVTQYDISTEIANWKVVEFLKENADDFKDFFVGVDGERIETTRVKDIIRLSTIDADGYKHMFPEEETIDDYVMSYLFYSDGELLGDITGSTTFEELIESYDHQFPNLIKRISLKLRDCYDYREYQAWMYLLEQSRNNNSIEFIFKDCDTFTEYLQYTNSISLLSYIRSNVNMNSSNKISQISACIDELTTFYKNWINENITELLYGEDSEDNESTNSSYVKDMIILFNEFLSIYSELYSVDYNYSLGNLDYEGLNLQLFYNPTNLLFMDKFKDHIGLRYSIKSHYSPGIVEEWLLLKYSSESKEYKFIEDAINNNLIYDEKTNLYIPEDFLTYENSSMYFKHIINDIVGISDKLYHNIKTKLMDETISLQGQLKITYNGVTKNYYA